MQYDTLNFDSYEDPCTSYTIKDLIGLAKQYPNHKFKLLDTDYTVGDLGSWRGSYDLPAIEPELGTYKTGQEIAKALTDQLSWTHCGWKGSEYKYHEYMEFYVAPQGSSYEFKVVGFKEEEDNVIILMTKIDKY